MEVLSIGAMRLGGGGLERVTAVVEMCEAWSKCVASPRRPNAGAERVRLVRVDDDDLYTSRRKRRPRRNAIVFKASAAKKTRFQDSSRF